MKNKKIVASFLIGLLFAVALGILVVFSRSVLTWNARVLVVLLGAVLGWLAGMIASPYDQKDAKKFTAAGKVVSAFASGYLVSKIDRLFEEAMKKGQILQEPFIFSSGMFLTSFVLAALMAFIGREYWEG